MARGVYSQAEGIVAEYQAAQYLIAEGYRIIAQNYNVPKIGELDIVAMQGETLVIVEVKYRKDGTFGTGVESVTPAKAKKLVRATAAFLHNEEPDYKAIRFDMIEVTDLNINHIPNAFYGTFL